MATSDGIPKLADAVELGISSYGSDDVVLERPGGRARAARHAKFVENVAHMPGNSLFADEELIGDGAIRLADCEQSKDLCFAFAEWIDTLIRSARRVFGDAREPGFGFELRE